VLTIISSVPSQFEISSVKVMPSFCLIRILYAVIGVLPSKGAVHDNETCVVEVTAVAGAEG
jgi:hypothetical protein